MSQIPPRMVVVSMAIEASKMCIGFVNRWNKEGKISHERAFDVLLSVVFSGLIRGGKRGDELRDHVMALLEKIEKIQPPTKH